MKRQVISALAAVAAMVAAASCSRDPETAVNALSRQRLESWMSIHYPGVEPEELGYYLVRDEAGSGATTGDASQTVYLYGRYDAWDLDGTYSYTDDRRIAKQLGTFDTTAYYGPRVWNRGGNNLPVGLDDVMTGMREGGRRTAVIPSWLMTQKRYSKPEEYLKHSTSYSHGIYDIRVDQIIPDIVEWEIDSLKSYMAAHYPDVDSTMYGYYYVQTVPPVKETGYESGDQVYFNYIGRRLDGQVFDCTVRDTARRYNIYSESRDYEPVYMTWADEYTGLTLGENGSTVVPGFSYTAFNMRKGEKGIAIFYSYYGYADSGSGNLIPSFSPLIFELECVGMEDESDEDETDDDGDTTED